MSNKFAMDLNKFIERVNKKNKNHSGKRVKFSWLKRKRK